MKKIIGILLIVIMCFSSLSFATEIPSVVENTVDITAEDVENIVDNTVEETDIEDETEDVDEIDDDEFDFIKDYYDEDMINDDVFRIDDDVLIDQDVDGNVYVIARNLRIEDAVIFGNLYVIAENIDIYDANISGSVYSMSEKMNFSGTTGDIYAICSEINFGKDTYIERNARLAGDTISINGMVDKNVYVNASDLVIGDETEIVGELNYSADNEVLIPESAEIGNVKFNKNIELNENGKSENYVAEYLLEIVTIAFKTLIIALIIVFGIDKFKTIKRNNSMASDLLKNTGIGVLAIICVPIISILLMVTIIGLGFGIVLLTLYICALYIASSVLAVEVANRLLIKEENTRKSKLIGLAVFVSLILWIIELIPLVGEIVKIIVLLMGMGVITNIVLPIKKEEESLKK